MSKIEETRTVPLWKLKGIEDTLRLVSNTLKSSNRETCLDRNIMRSWNDVSDMIHKREPTSSESLGYYMTKGQVPKNNDE